MKLNNCAKLEKSYEKELLQEYSDTNSQRIKNVLFEAYYPLVKLIAYNIYKRSPKSKVELADLISDGSCGLLIAIDKFNPAKAEILYPVAYLWIKEYVHRGVMKNLSMVRDISTNSKTRLLYHRFRRTVFTLGFELPLTESNRISLSETLKVPVFDIAFFETVMHDNLNVDDILHMGGCSEQDDVNEQIDLQKLKTFIDHDVMPNLNEKERYIVKTRILSEQRVEEVAAYFNQSKAGIYQTEKRLKEVIKNGFLARMDA